MKIVNEELCTEDVLEKYRYYEKVVEALRNKRFVCLHSTSNTEICIFRGQQRDYVVIPCRWCTCNDFIINVLSRGIKQVCYHIAGFVIAMQEGKIIDIDVNLQELTRILYEIAFYGISITLRRMTKF